MKTVLKLSVLIVVWIELILQIVDPWGIKYIYDINELWSYIASSDVMYYLPSGHYSFHNWSVTQQHYRSNSIRNTPASSGDCPIAFIGDSMTWGHGMNDEDTWVNLVAQAYPNIRAFNVALSGYNSEQVKYSTAFVPNAKLYVYYVIGNDDDPTTIHQHQFYGPMLRAYASIIFYRDQLNAAKDNQAGIARFKQDVAELQTRGNVIFIGDDTPFIRSILDANAVTGWVHFSSHNRLSLVDAHPNKAGHKELAAQFISLLKDKIESVCS